MLTKRPGTLRVLMLAAIALAALQAAAWRVSGTVKDNDGEGLIGASVRLLTPRDSAVVRTAVADADGRYTLDRVNDGRYVLELSYIGYTPVTETVRVKGADVKIPDRVLQENATMLRETVVRGVRTPVKVMEDTVEFAAEAYKTQPNAVVEDLLKRLPGVEVGTNGSITANGKTVTKILVDGKEFFSDDPTVASKNLPVNMVDKLQVVDRKSDLARITGVDDGEEETVINLTVKKGMKNGWFGNAEAGYGTDSRYKGTFTVNRFWNDHQITLLGGLNNINEPGFTDGANGRFRRFGGDNGLTRSKAMGLNFNVGNKEIVRVGGNVMYSHTDRRTLTDRDRQYLFTDSTSYFTSNSRAKDKGHNVRADLRIEWKPDSFNTIDFRPNLSYNANDSYSNDSSLTRSGRLVDVTRSRNMQLSDGNSWEFGARLIYNHMFRNRPGRSFSVQGTLRTSNVHEYENTLSWNRFFLLGDSLDVYDQYLDNHTWSNTAGGRVSWTEPLGDPRKGNSLTLSYRINYRWNNADKMTYDRPTDPLAYLPGIPADVAWANDSLQWNADLSNRFRNDYMNQDIRLGYKHTSRNVTFDGGISLVPQRSESKDLIDSRRDLARTTFNVAPYLRYRLKMTKTRSLNINYRGRSSQPSISQLQPVADMSDPLRVVIGNPDLDPTFTHNVSLRFQDFNPGQQRSLMAMLNASVVQNSIVSTIEHDPVTGGQTTRYTNVNGVWNAFGGLMFSMPLRNKSWYVSANFMGRYNHNIGFTNARRATTGTANLNFMPGVAFRPDNLELELRPKYSVQMSSGLGSAAGNGTVHTYGGMFNGTYYTPWGLVLSTDLDYAARAGYAAGYNTRTWMWNASLAYQFLPAKAGTVTLKAYDLLNQRSNISRNVTSQYIDDVRYNSLTRYFMVSFTYKFNTFGSGKEPAGRSDMYGPRGPGGPPPGGPGGPPPGHR